MKFVANIAVMTTCLATSGCIYALESIPDPEYLPRHETEGLVSFQRRSNGGHNWHGFTAYSLLSCATGVELRLVAANGSGSRSDPSPDDVSSTNDEPLFGFVRSARRSGEIEMSSTFKSIARDAGYIVSESRADADDADKTEACNRFYPDIERHWETAPALLCDNDGIDYTAEFAVIGECDGSNVAVLEATQ